MNKILNMISFNDSILLFLIFTIISFTNVCSDYENLLKHADVAALSKLLDDHHNNTKINDSSNNNITSDVSDYNEIYPNLFLSKRGTAKNKNVLQSIGVTHVLNAHEGEFFSGTKNLCIDFYNTLGIKYVGFSMNDVYDEPIFRYFDVTSDFIEEGLKLGGKVLVHSEGQSKSETLVLAYLIMKKNFTAQNAILHIMEKYQEIRPNNGFIYQLLELQRYSHLQHLQSSV